jgi:3-methyladenine DNA glycosylase AlkC
MEKRASNNSDAIKKIKKSSLLSLSSKWNPTHNHTTSRFSQI